MYLCMHTLLSLSTSICKGESFNEYYLHPYPWKTHFTRIPLGSVFTEARGFLRTVEWKDSQELMDKQSLA